MSGRKRMFALLLCVGMALMLLVSSAYLVSVAGHCCGAHGCKICEAMNRTEKLLSAFTFCAVLTALFLRVNARAEETGEKNAPFARRLTLVGWKVQLNN